MRYTGTKFSASEAEQICRETRVRIRLAEQSSRDESIQRRDSSAGIVHKTIDDARIPVSSAADAQQITNWTEWVDARIEARAAVQCEAVGEMLAELGHALDGVRRDLQLLRNQFELDIKIDRRIAALNSEVAQARQQAPDFQRDLNTLQAQVDKLQKSAGALRAQNSTLEFKYNKLAGEQQTNKEKVTLTAVQMTSIGGQTREVLERLRNSGFVLSEEVEPFGPPGLLS
jgi:chromosome segregation ATPase